jgi:hypothetical protein
VGGEEITVRVKDNGSERFSRPTIQRSKILGALLLQQFSTERSWATVALIPIKPGDAKTVVKEARGGISIAFL